MGTEMMIYLQQLELLAFFSGYPLVYAIVASVRNPKAGVNAISNKAFYLLPVAYAVVSVLYIGLLLRNFYPNYSFEFIRQQIQIPFFVAWAITCLGFFISWLRKHPVISLLHSLVFLFLIVMNFYRQIAAPGTDKLVLKNYMNVYFNSVLLHTITVVFLLLIYYSTRKFLGRKNTSLS